MTAKEKKDLVLSKLERETETRSYNEIMADLELELWTTRHKGLDYVRSKVRIN